MDREDIQAYLQSEDPQQRLRGLRELRLCSTEMAIPLLQLLVEDPEFLVRSQVAMGLGKHRNDAGFESLPIPPEERGRLQFTGVLRDGCANGGRDGGR